MKMEEAFPCPLERTVAASLLLLSTSASSLMISPTTTTSKTNSIDLVDMSCLRSKQCNSRSCSSSVISDEGESSSVVEIWKHRGANFKVVQRSRSKTQSIISSFSCGSDSALSSNLSSSSIIGGISNSVTYRNIRDNKSNEKELAQTSSKTKQPAASSSRMRLRSESILVILSLTATSEVRIRQLLGDSPDTSKALRMLLKLEKIRRSGAGGRVDPYIYTLA